MAGNMSYRLRRSGEKVPLGEAHDDLEKAHREFAAATETDPAQAVEVVDDAGTVWYSHDRPSPEASADEDSEGA
jgi:hypothetical protein